MDAGDSTLCQMRPLDPLLLGSFPAPPTHIPRTPTSPNPPPSRPPSSPLPPLPAHVHVAAPTVRPSDSLAAIDVRDILHAASAFDDESGDSRQAALPPLGRALSVADPIDPQTMSNPASPRRTVFSPSSPPRSSSPDIPAILSATPRPRANSLHKSKFKAANPYGVYRHPDSLPSDDDDYDARSWIDYDDFARPKDEESRFDDLERHLEGFDSDASDSSLDLHTPLPHLMMRHGLLSPQSKLITQPSARDSVTSIASTTTSKSPHPLKDARDTVKRRVRHRDGRLLRGGIGLTTGLGWSDSEDEDAPSALTRRISSLNLTNRSSASSLVLSRSTNSLSSAPSRSSSGTSDYHTSLPSRKSSSASARPFARSYSSTSLRISDYTPEVDEFGKITSQKSPNTACKPRTPITKLSIKTRGSAGAIPENEEIDTVTDTFSRYTPTSPDITLAEFHGGAQLNREKSLPPLPRSSVIDNAMSMPPSRTIKPIGTIRRSSESNVGTTEGRARSISGASWGSTGSTSLISPASVRATITKVSTPLETATSMLKSPRSLRLTSPTSPHGPAPLLLAQRQQKPHDRRPVPVPAVSVDTHICSPLLDSRGSLPSTPSTPSPVTPGMDRPRPRVGTGMTYRSSVGRMRPPSSIRSSVTLNIQNPIPS